jgi:hypothetical protein
VCATVCVCVCEWRSESVNFVVVSWLLVHSWGSSGLILVGTDW